MTNANDKVEIRRIASARGVIVFDASLLPQGAPDLHDASCWPNATRLSGRGGRGGACVVEAEFGKGLLRHYRRGGLVGRWIRDRYLYLGESATRCLREFEVLVEMRRRGLPVPRPVFAAWQRRGAFYRADLMTAMIANTQTLAERLSADCRIDWAGIGTTIARFHRAGVFHADLNAHNILIDTDAKVWLIDFDRGYLRTPAKRWQQANLRRLQRSLSKLGGLTIPIWSELESAYQAAMATHTTATHGP